MRLTKPKHIPRDRRERLRPIIDQFLKEDTPVMQIEEWDKNYKTLGSAYHSIMACIKASPEYRDVVRVTTSDGMLYLFRIERS